MKQQIGSGGEERSQSLRKEKQLPREVIKECFKDPGNRKCVDRKCVGHFKHGMCKMFKIHAFTYINE